MNPQTITPQKHKKNLLVPHPWPPPNHFKQISITTRAPTIFSKQSRPKKTKISAQITNLKRCAPTINTFASTDIRPKCYKKFPLPFEHHRTSFTTHSTTSSTSSTITKITPPNIKCQSLLNSPPPLLLNIPLPTLSSTTPLPPLPSAPPFPPLHQHHHHHQINKNPFPHAT